MYVCKTIDQMEKKNESSQKNVGLLGMISEHADWIDMILMVVGTAGCIANGLSISLIVLVLSRMSNGYASLSSIIPADVNQVSLTFL